MSKLSMVGGYTMLCSGIRSVLYSILSYSTKENS